MRLVSLTAITVIAFLFPLFGAVDSFPLYHYTADCYDSTRGLPQNSVRSVAKDSDGYVYLATQEGVVIFNGEQMHVLDHRSEPSLLSDDILSMLSLHDDQLLIGTTKGTFLIKNHHVASNSQKYAQYAITALVKGSNGALWIGTKNNGVIRQSSEGVEQRFFKEDGTIHSNRIHTLFVTDLGKVYAGTDEGVEYFDHSRFTKIPQLYRPVFAIAGTEKELWLASGGGLALVKNNKKDYLYTTEDGLPSTGIKSVLVRTNGDIWFGPERGGIGRFAHGHFTFLPTVNQHKIGPIISMTQDDNGTIWIGTETRGFCLLHRGAVYHSGLDDEDVRSITTDETGTIWAATSSHGLVKLTPDGISTRLTQKDGLRSDVLSVVFMDSNSRLWIGTRHNGVQMMEGGKIHDIDAVTNGFNSEFPISVRVIFQDSYGTIWMADRLSQAPLFSWQNGILSTYTLPQTKQTVSGIVELNSRELVVVTSDGGIYHFDRQKKQFKLQQKITVSGTVSSVMKDFNDRLLLTVADGGISIVHDGKVTVLTEKQRLYDNSVHAGITDNKGNYWFTTNQGVFTITQSAMESYINGNAPTVSFRLFKESDGMTSSECNGGSQPSLWLSPSGTLLIPTVRGIVSIDPDRVSLAPPSPAIHIESVSAGHKKLLKNRTQTIVTAPIDNRNIAVSYTSLSFLHQGRIHYAYRLSGVDSAWKDAGTRTTAYYTNLAPGKYMFSVKASYIDFPAISSTTSINIIVPGYFWEQRWFKIALFFTLLFLIVLFVHIRTTEHKKRAEELQQLVHEKTRELLKKNDELKQAALQDGITGMLNRRYLFEIERAKIDAYLGRIHRIIENKDRREEQPPSTIYAAFMVSINHFVGLTNQYGHEAWDSIVKKTAALIYEHIRKDDLIVRWSDDTFLVILKNTEPDFVPLFTKKIQHLIAQTPFELPGNGRKTTISVSIGAVHIPFCPGQPLVLSCEQTLLVADFAVQKAKQLNDGASVLITPKNTELLKTAIKTKPLADILKPEYIALNVLTGTQDGDG